MAQHDPRILLRDAFLGRDEVFGLQSVIDCFVSLHRAEGLGLGLFICHNIVANHGGRIEVQSQEGEGTEVRVWLPA